MILDFSGVKVGGPLLGVLMLTLVERGGVLNRHSRRTVLSPLGPPEEELSASLWIYGRFIVLH